MGETIEVKKVCGICVNMPTIPVDCHILDRHVNKGLTACDGFKLDTRYRPRSE